jgi:hypothetical protein
MQGLSRLGCLAGTAGLLALALAAPADARKFQMSGTWMMRRGASFIPIQLGGCCLHVSMGHFTEAPFDPPGQVLSAVAGATATGASPATVELAKHRFVRSQPVHFPLLGTMLVQIATTFGIDAPYATATLHEGGGPGSFTWCPSNPACTAAGPIPGGIGSNGRVVYIAGPNQFGGTMQMGLRGGGLVSVKGVGPGRVGHVRFGGSGPTLRKLAVGAPQMGPDLPATEFVKVATGVITSPIGGIPASGVLITMPGPIVGMFPSITTPMGGMAGQFTHWGFPHTTGTVLVQQDNGSGGDDFFTVMGSDLRTPLGAGNLSTVAGGLARQNTLGGDDNYAQFDRVSMSFGAPVPSLSPAGLATAGMLLLLAAGYALRRRRA